MPKKSVQFCCCYFCSFYSFNSSLRLSAPFCLSPAFPKQLTWESFQQGGGGSSRSVALVQSRAVGFDFQRLAGGSLQESDISHGAAGKIFSFSRVLPENRWQWRVKMLKLYPNVELWAVWDRRGMLKVEEMAGVRVFTLPCWCGSLNIWLSVAGCLLYPAHSSSSRVGQQDCTTGTKRYHRGTTPVWMPSLGTSRALSLIKLALGRVSVLWPQVIMLRLNLCSGGNYVPGIVDHSIPGERNAQRLLMPKNEAVVYWFNE